MLKNKLPLWIFIIIIAVLIIPLVYAPECNQSIGSQSDLLSGCSVSSSLTLNSGTYYLNSSGTGTSGLGKALPLIFLNATGITLDCSFSNIIGNNSGIGISFNQSKASNSIIKNCNVTNYDHGINADSTNLNITIQDNFVINMTTDGIRLGASNNGTIKSNVMTNATFNSDSGDNHTIEYNNITCTQYCGKRDYGLRLQSTSVANSPSVQHLIRFNLIDGISNSIRITTNISNSTIMNNTLKNGDIGLFISDNPQANISIAYNIFQNITFDYDSFDVGIRITNSSLVNMDKNNFTEIGTVGIYLQKGGNFTITNNTFNFINISRKLNYTFQDTGQPVCAISILEAYKTYIGRNLERASDNITNLTTYLSSNITLTTNTYQNTACYLHTQGTTNIRNDVPSNHWFVSHQFPTFLFDKEELWLNPKFTNLSTKRSTEINGSLTQSYSAITGGDQLRSRMMIYQIFKDFRLYENVNRTQAYNLSFNNLTNALVYYNNNTIVCNSILSCDNQINITSMPSRNITYVLNEYNLTEGVNRQNNPIYFNETSFSKKVIFSNITQAAYIPILFNVSTCSSDPKSLTRGDIYINSISYLSSTGNISFVDIDCVNSIKTINANVNNGENNTITIDYKIILRKIIYIVS